MVELDVVKKPSTPRFAAYRKEFAPSRSTSYSAFSGCLPRANKGKMRSIE